MPSSAPPPSRLDTRYARVFATTTADSTSVVIRPRQTLPSPPSYPPPSHSWWTDKRGPATTAHTALDRCWYCALAPFNYQRAIAEFDCRLLLPQRPLGRRE